MAKKTYRVKKGDNYFKIAEKLWGNQLFAGQLIRANPGINKLFPGIVLRLPKVDRNDPHPFFGQAAWERARAGRTSGSSGRLPGQTPPYQEGMNLDRQQERQRRREELLDAKLGPDLPGYEYDVYPQRSGPGYEEDPAYGRRGVQRAPGMRREDIPDWVYEDFAEEDFGDFTLEEVWDEVSEFVKLAEKLGLAPGSGLGQDAQPKSSREIEKPEGAGVLGAPGKVGRLLPETAGDEGAEEGELRSVQQGGDEDEQKTREELLNIWEDARKSDEKMMAQYGSGEMDLEEVDWEVNWLTTLDIDELEDVVYGRRELVEEEDLVEFLEAQGISSSNVFGGSDYVISDLPLSELDSGGKQQIARHLGMGGSQPGIQHTDLITQIEVLQNYWGLDDKEMLSVLREIYYPKGLDDFLANASDVKIPEISDKAVELEDGRIITKEEAAYALTMLMFGQPLRGDLDENNPALGYRGALVPVMYGEGESGIDHVIAGLEGFENPVNKDDDVQMKNGLKRKIIVNYLGSEEIVAGQAISWEGDLGGVVYELIKNPDFSLDEAYAISMPNQDLEGDILATVLYTQLREEDKIRLVEGIRVLYDPEQPYYDDRYELFAEEILSEFVQGAGTIKDIVDPETGNIYPAVKEAFIDRHRINVRNYAIGLLVTDTEVFEGVFKDPKERLSELGVDVLQMDEYAYNVLDRFLNDLEERLKQEK